MDKKDLGYFSNARKEMLPFIPASCNRILEIGCGEGLFGSYLKKTRTVEVWGVEQDEDATLEARKNLDSVIQGNFLEIENQLPRNHFDCVIFNDVLEHFTDPWDLISKIKPLLTPGGYIVASIPNVRYVRNLYELLIKKDWEYKSSGILDITHFRFYTKKSIIRMFESTGFSIVDIRGINPTRSFLVKLGIFFSFGLFNDIAFQQFASVARLSSDSSR